MSINGAQSVRLEKGTIEFKNLFIQILVPSKIYSDFECVLNSAESCKGFCSNQDCIPFSFANKLICVVHKFSKPILFTEVKMLQEEEYEYCRKVMKKNFNKNWIMTEKEQF